MPSGGSATSGHSAITFTSDQKSTRLNSSHVRISYAVFCLKKKTDPEKTLGGFRKADTMGFRGVEFDVILSADKIPLLIHDETLDFFFFFNDTATTEIYTLSLHDALPI